MQRRYLSICFLKNFKSQPAPNLKPLLVFCKRYTPLVSLDEPFGILLDTTGCEALFHGERALLNLVKKDMESLGFFVQVALAPTPLCARSMARFKPFSVIQTTDLPQALYQLPIAALSLEAKAEDTLRELGINRLLELFRLPRAQLLKHFGVNAIDRIDEIRGEKKEPRVFAQDAKDWFIEEHLMDTVRDSSYLCEAVFDILKRLCAMLSKDGLGITKLELALTHLDRKETFIHIGLVQPSADTQKIFRLLTLKLESLDAGLGIETVKLRAIQTKQVKPQKMTLSYDDIPIETDLSVLFDTLVNRAGSKSIFQFASHENYLPENDHKKVSPVSFNRELKSTTTPQHCLNRPTRIFENPEPIEVIAMLPDSPPRRITWRERFIFHVVKADGPERIESQWWENNHSETRDYYSIEDERGLRLWVFKQTSASHPVSMWYLHGLLA